MKSIHKHAIAAGLLALGLAAAAQTPPGAGPGPGPGGMGMGGMGHMSQRHHGGRFDSARMQERMAQHQAALKQKLQLTPAQEGAWGAFVAAMKPPANVQRPDRAEFDKLSTPERIDRMRALRTERQAEMDKRADATKTFYAGLTAEQKKVFDAETARGHRGGPRHYRG